MHQLINSSLILKTKWQPWRIMWPVLVHFYFLHLVSLFWKNLLRVRLFLLLLNGSLFPFLLSVFSPLEFFFFFRCNYIFSFSNRFLFNIPYVWLPIFSLMVCFSFSFNPTHSCSIFIFWWVFLFSLPLSPITSRLSQFSFLKWSIPFPCMLHFLSLFSNHTFPFLLHLSHSNHQPAIPIFLSLMVLHSFPMHALFHFPYGACGIPCKTNKNIKGK